MGRRKEKPSMSMSIPCCMQPCFAFFFQPGCGRNRKLVPVLCCCCLCHGNNLCACICALVHKNSGRGSNDASRATAEPQPKAEQKQRRRGRRKYPVPVSWKGHGVGVLQSGTHRGTESVGKGGRGHYVRSLCASKIHISA